MTGMLRWSQEQLDEYVKRLPIASIRKVTPMADADLIENGKPGARKKVEKKRKPRKPTTEELLAIHLSESGLPDPVRQHHPLPDRAYRLDFSWPELKFAIEVDGVVHRIKERFIQSFEREFLLKKAGWNVLHVSSYNVREGVAIKWIRELFPVKSGEAIKTIKEALG